MDFLKEHLNDDLYQQLKEALEGKEDKVKLANLRSGDYVSKQKFLDAEKQANTLQTSLQERDDQLKKLSENSGNADELKQAIADLKQANDDAAKKYADDLATAKLNSAVALAISNARPVDETAAKAIQALIDPEIIKISEDGEVVGVDDQLAKLKESSVYLFEGKSSSAGGGDGNPPDDDDSGEDENNLSDEELYNKRMQERANTA